MSIVNQVASDKANTRKDTHCSLGKSREVDKQVAGTERGRAWRERGEVAASGMDSGRNRRGSKDKDT